MSILENTKAREIRDVKISEAKEADLILGNMQDIKLSAVLQTIRQEAKARNYMHESDIIDLLLRFIAEDGKNGQYLREVFFPLSFICFLQDQIEILIAISSMKLLAIGYLDATGKVVRSPKELKKRTIFYYALVINVNKKILPISLITSR